MVTHFMDASDAAAASGMPLIYSRDIAPLTLENPSTFDLAVIGLVTLAAYWGVKRLVWSGKGTSIAEGGGDRTAVPRDERVDEPSRGAA